MCPIPGPPDKKLLPEKNWHDGIIPYCFFIGKPDRLDCLSPLHPPENARPLPIPPTHDPRLLLQRRPPKTNSFQMAWIVLELALRKLRT
jgi:hypothetical protein